VERAFTPHRRRTWPLLLLFLAGSTMLHAAALIVLPGFLPAREVPQFTLEVVLVQAAAVQPQPGRDQAAIAPLMPPRQSESHTPVLALPEPSAVAESALSAPQAEESSSRQGEPKAEAASVALTPPSFSAAYLRNPPPHYPPAARHTGEQGTVTLRVLVTRAGLASRVTVERSSGSPHLDAAALEAVKAWRFAPARHGAEPVESWMLVPIVFRLEAAS